MYGGKDELEIFMKDLLAQVDRENQDDLKGLFDGMYERTIAACVEDTMDRHVEEAMCMSKLKRTLKKERKAAGLAMDVLVQCEEKILEAQRGMKRVESILKVVDVEGVRKAKDEKEEAERKYETEGEIEERRLKRGAFVKKCREELRKCEKMLQKVAESGVSAQKKDEKMQKRLMGQLGRWRNATTKAMGILEEKTRVCMDADEVETDDEEKEMKMWSAMTEAKVKLRIAMRTEIGLLQNAIGTWREDAEKKEQEMIAEMEKSKGGLHNLLLWKEEMECAMRETEEALDAGQRKGEAVERMKRLRDELDESKTLLSEIQRGGEWGGGPCCNCEEKGSVRCPTCGDLFCEECFASVHGSGKRAKHKKIKVGEDGEEGTVLERQMKEVAEKRRLYEEAKEEVNVIRRRGYPEVEREGGGGVWKRSKLEEVALIRSEELEKVVREIGGGLGSRVSAVEVEGVGLVAVKRIAMGGEGGMRLREEAMAMWKLRHKNVVELIGVCEEVGKEALVMELAEEGSLKDEIYGRAQRMERRRMEEVLEQVLRGLGFMHRQKYVHLDVKSSNVLCFKGGVVKLGDFGTAKEREETATWMTRREMTLRWSAPERLKDKVVKVTGGADVWSVGMVVVEMVSGKVPYAHLAIEMVAMAIVKGELPDVNGEEYGWCRAMLKRCWETEPEKRGLAEELQGLMRRRCMVCWGEGEVRGGVECGEDVGHYVCRTCVVERMKAMVEKREVWEDGRMGCMVKECVGTLRGEELVEKGGGDVGKMWAEESARARERREKAVLQRRIEELEEEKRLGAVRSHVNRITDQVLNVACPRCGKVFVDFDGCFALTMQSTRMWMCILWVVS